MIFLFVVAALIVYIAILYNSLVNIKNNTTKAWANIDILLKQRHDEIEKLVTTCQQYMRFEQETLKQVMLSRAGVSSASLSNNAIALGTQESKLRAGLGKLFALAEAVPESQPGLISAFGWISARVLKGTGAALLNHPQPFRKRVAVAACAMHRADPGAALDSSMVAPDAPLRAQALRCAGELGRRNLLPNCIDQLNDKDSVCAFWAAWAAVLLGDRGSTVSALRQLALLPGPYRARALRLALKVLPNTEARTLLTALSQNVMNQRALIRGTGFAGDPYYVPWLIKQMADLKATRLAGEAFSFITGLDLAYLDLDQKPPENFESGPSDDPKDDNVAMDEDDGLPWPDPVKIQAWWSANSHRFQSGVCYFMGEPVSRAHCIKVLKEGYQRQRIAAAEYLCLLNPGTPLFNTSAPAWRQKRLLEKME